jgi:hypothetical protein
MTDTKIRGVHVGAGIDIDDVAQPGRFQFQDMAYQPIDGFADVPADGQLRLEYCCPRTGKACGGIIIGKGFKPARGAPSWQWDGNVLAPSLTPSINCQGGCGWHGYLTEGEWVPC